MNVQPETRRTPLEASRFLGRAAVTLLLTPSHHRIYRDIKTEALAAQEIIPLHGSVADVADACKPYLNTVKTVDSPGAVYDQVTLAALLIQFGDHLPTVPEPLKIPYDHIQHLHQTVTATARDYGRVSLSTQLGIALEQTDSNMAQALHLLCIGSRLYARWLDEQSVTGIPHPPSTYKKMRMAEWQNALQGFKSAPGVYHDAAGDTYYAWTHAYAGYTFGATTEHAQPFTTVARHAFRHGTLIMQTCVNNFNPRGILSDHTIAAHYGNAIADVCNNARKKLV